MRKYRPMPYDKPEFSGPATFMRLPATTDLEGADFTVVGVPFDTGGSWRVGCRFGPSAIRSISRLLWPFDAQWRADIFDYVSGTDYGDLPVVPGYHEESNKRIAQALRPVMEAGVVPILLGGDHSITLPVLRAVANVHGPVALIHLDSHLDTWDNYFGQPYWHGSPISRAVEEGLIDGTASTQLGLRGGLDGPDVMESAERAGMKQFFAGVIHEIGWKPAIRDTLARARGHKVYLSFDVDFLDPSVAPGTGTPEVGGFGTREAISFLRALEDLEFVGFDMVEVLPPFDPGEITSLAAATMVYEFIRLLAAAKRQRTG
ncbi:MAG: agmatinase [Bacillota bacterium]